MTESETLVDGADRAVEKGDLATARTLLSAALEQDPANFPALLKLAGIERALASPQKALAAVDRALALAPRDFMALVMRATLIEQLDEAASGEAWAIALAQSPSETLPGALGQAVARGELRRDRWIADREKRMKLNMAAAERRAGADEAKRLARFRSNALGRTKAYHSEPTDYHYPGLPEFEFHPRRKFSWLEKLERASELIRSEFNQLLESEHRDLQPYVQYDDHLPLDGWAPLNRNLDWTAVHLLNSGERIDANARHCPLTLDLLASLPQPRIEGFGPNAMFSLLAPGTTIPPHVGVSNTRLVCHLPLHIPQDCTFRVGAETREWKEGEAFVFDDTIEHEARNGSDQLRVVFIFDVWNPDLEPAEREGITAMMNAISGTAAFTDPHAV